jgi:hypothetical protein
MAAGSLNTQPPVEASKGSNWRGSQAFSGELDVIEGIKPAMDGIDGSFGAISRIRRPETMRDVVGQPGRGGDKIINDPI